MKVTLLSVNMITWLRYRSNDDITCSSNIYRFILFKSYFNRAAIFLSCYNNPCKLPFFSRSLFLLKYAWQAAALICIFIWECPIMGNHTQHFFLKNYHKQKYMTIVEKIRSFFGLMSFFKVKQTLFNYWLNIFFTITPRIYVSEVRYPR